MHSIPYINYPYGEEINERPHADEILLCRSTNCKGNSAARRPWLVRGTAWAAKLHQATNQANPKGPKELARPEGGSFDSTNPLAI